MTRATVALALVAFALVLFGVALFGVGDVDPVDALAVGGGLTAVSVAVAVVAPDRRVP